MTLRRASPAPYLFLLPAGAVLGTFFLAAFAQVVYFSCTRYTAFTPPAFVGLENYQRLLASERFWFCLVNSFLYLLVTPVLIAASLGAALVVDSGIRGSRVWRLLLFLPVITPTIVGAIAWRLLLNEDAGLINRALGALGIAKVHWLTERPWTLVSPMLVTLWKGFGFYMMVFLAGLMAVPRELREAAAVDGAGKLGTFSSVTLPALRPVIALVAVISSISAMKVFDEVFITVRGAPIDHQTAVPLVYQTAFEEGDFGMACAAGVVLFAVVLAMSLLSLRLSRSGPGADGEGA